MTDTRSGQGIDTDPETVRHGRTGYRLQKIHKIKIETTKETTRHTQIETEITRHTGRLKQRQAVTEEEKNK